MPFCDIDSIEDFLQITVTNLDGANQAIDAATAAIQEYCGQRIEQVLGDLVTLRSRGQSVLILPEQPVTAVTSVVENGAALVVDTDFSWTPDGLLQRWPGGWKLNNSVWGTVVVTYSHGYATVPEIIRDVCIRSASRAYQGGLRAAAVGAVPGVASEQLPDYQISYQADTAAGGASSLGASAAPFLLPSEKELLNRYRMKP